MCENCTCKSAEVFSGKARGFEVLPEFADFGIEVPKSRKTKRSAGYDLAAIQSGTIWPNSMTVVETGLTVYMQDDENLDLHIRSGLAAEHHLTLQNDVGIVDADYYGRHIKLLIRNEGERPFTFIKGERLAQGIFRKYLLVDGDSFEQGAERSGGFGSTGK